MTYSTNTLTNLRVGKATRLTSGGIAAGMGAAAIVALALHPAPARAATAVSTMAVSATVAATCTNTITTLPFGTYTGAVVDVTATITVTCTDTTAYNIGLDAGLGAGATVTTRAMQGPATDTVAYVLTSDAAHAVNWGNTVGTDTVPGTGNGAAQPILIYGEVAAGELESPGAYTDTITATVTY